MIVNKLKQLIALCLLVLPSARATDTDTYHDDLASETQGSLSLDPQLYECFKRKGLHFLHINARSLPSKLSEIRLIAQQTRVTAICISESWLDSTVTDAEIMVDGYNIIRNDRNRHGGGVCMYIRSDLDFNIRTDLQTDIQDIEAVRCDILLPRTKPILLGTTYRPQTHTRFVENFDDVLSKCDLSQETYILGDFNICLLNSSPNCAL